METLRILLKRSVGSTATYNNNSYNNKINKNSSTGGSC